jgi:tetratricopeptide (TPR) repeat protein
MWAVPGIPVRLDSVDRATSDLLQRVIGGAAALRNPYTARFLPLATLPPTFEAYQEFVDGVAQSSQGQFAEARRHFRLAVAHDSSFTWPMVEAALIGLNWVALSSAAQNDSILDALTRIRGRIPPLQRYLLDYLLALKIEDWRAAYRAVCEAGRLAPQRFAYRCGVAASQVNRPRATIGALTESPGVDSLHRGDTQNYWLVLTLAYHQLGEYRNELAAARQARENRPDSPSALSQEIRALAALGSIAAVRAGLDTVVALGREGWFTPATAMIEAAQELRAHGQPEAAGSVAARAIAWHRARPAEERATEARRYQLGWTLYFHGDWAAADSLFRALHAEFPGNEDYLGFLGAIAARRGHHQTAESVAVRLATLEHWVPVPGRTATVWRAKIAALLGERDAAVSLLRDAFGPDGTFELHADPDFEPIRGHPRFLEFIRPKG